MADPRKWIKISLNLPRHPKMVVVQAPARWLFVEMLCYCSEYMTDGVVPEVVAMRLATNTASDTLSNLLSIMLSNMPSTELSKELSNMLSTMLDACLPDLADQLLEELTGNGDPATLSRDGDDYVIHDYLDHQASRKDVLARRKHLREAGRRGGLAKAKQDAKHNAKQNPSKMLSKGFSKGFSKNLADKDKDIDTSKEKIYKKENQPPAKTRKRAVPLPADWKPNPTHARIALERGIDLEAQAEKFRDYARAHGKAYRDWDAGFRNWLRSPYVQPENASPRYRTQADQIERMFQVAAASDLADQAAQETAEIFTLPAPTGGDVA